MQKGQGLLQQQQGAKAGDGSSGAVGVTTIGSSPSLSFNNPSSLSHAAPPASPHTSSSSPSPSPNPNPNQPNPSTFPSPGFKSYPAHTATASPCQDFSPFHPNLHPPHQKPPHPSHFAQVQQHQQWQQHLHLMQQVQLQQQQQQQQQAQHHLHQQGQGQQQPQHHVQQQRKGVPSDQFPAFQGSSLSGVASSVNGGTSGGTQLLLSPRGFADVSQQQQVLSLSDTAQPPANPQQAQAQLYAHQQALLVAQKKVQANAQQQNKAADATDQGGSQSAQDAKRQQLQGQQGHQHAVSGKASGQFLLADQQMEQVHDLKTDMRMQPGPAPSMESGMRPPLAGGALQNQSASLLNGQPHAGMSPMPPLQSHHLDLSSRPILPPTQYMHPQLLAQFAAMQKVATDTGQLAHNSASKIQETVLRNFGPPSAQPHGGMVAESPGMVLGKGHQSMPGSIVPNANIRQQSQSQLSDYSMERGVLSLNRPAGSVPTPSVPILSKSSVGGPVPSRIEKSPGATTTPATQDAELQHLRQQQLQGSMCSSQVTNAIIQQAKFHPQMPQRPDGEHPQMTPLPQQQHPFFQQQGGIQHFQQQQLKQVQAMSQPQQQPQPNACFTRQQLMTLKSQILAFRRLKRGERIPPEVLLSIGIPAEVLRSMAASSQQSNPGTNTVERPPLPPAVESALTTTGKEDIGTLTVGMISSNATSKLDDKVHRSAVSCERAETLTTPPQSQVNVAVDTSTAALKPVEASMAARESTAGVGQPSSHDQVTKEDSGLASTSNVTSRPCSPNLAPSGAISKKPIGPPASNQQKPLQLLRRYRGPLFDFPPMGRKIEGLFQANNPWGAPIVLGYDVKQLLTKEAARVIDRKRVEKLKLIDALLTSGVEKKCIPAELVMKLRIEQKKLRLMALQVRVREEVEEHQQDIMALSERGYRKFVRSCERQRADLARQVIQLQKSTREKQLKSLFSWRKRILEAHWAVRDARTTRNRGVAKYHERMLREFSKRRDEDRNKRMEALKNNDVDTYREMLKQQQTKLPGDAGERFQVLSSFLSQTEDYLHKLGGKISAVKYQQEREEAAVTAVLAAKAQGLSEEEVEAAAIRAREEVDARLHSPDRASDSVSKYYRLAHAVNERIVRQPSMLRAGILRDYQLVGLQWMLSLYNNRLNGILADEMGLGKTVQVMALIAYLMEFKGNYGPHLIIVPNAVIVNWKSELLRWLPSVSCIFYVGGKEQRSKLYSQEVCAMKFNVLVTTYEFIMRDRSKLSKVDWKYLIIDEAQRMKDRESRLSRDLDRFRCQRRLLLTGTPLQNDLRELWSLLNLLLPEVFDNSKSFQDWFSMPFQKDSTSLSVEDDWLETEKKVIVIHRLHQILEPFMLRRRVEDVEGSLPPKVSIILRCKMSALQAAIYDWIKATGTIRLNPQDEELRVAAKNGKRQKRAYAPLQNKCMELRKVCNHPLLNYPFYGERMNEFSIRSCGKLWVLDRILIKLQNTGHRVLLFSTMTKLLDILEEYLQWRGLIYRRIDGTTTLESRESAIVEFNRPGSDCFIFLLSIRAAGRGLNLQTADTVIIYDPDPNPKNEEQAVARAHRIGQKREVRVLYMEAVVETISSFEKEDEIRCGGRIDMDDDDMAGKDRYVGSVESLVRNTIQQHKIEMADEVINAGRFDQRTTHEERRLTLEALLHDEERYQERVHDVPSMQEVNRMIARSDEELELFDQMDEEPDWPGEMIQHEQVPKWLCVGSREVNAASKAMSKQALKKGTLEGVGTAEAEERLLSEPFDKVSKMRQETSPEKTVGSQGDGNKRRKTSESGKYETATEVLLGRGQRSDYEDEEEGEIRKDFDGDDADVTMAMDVEPEEGEVSEEEVVGGGQPKIEFLDLNCAGEEATDGAGGASESSREEEAEEEEQTVRNEGALGLSSPLSQQKFGSLAALESRPTTQVTVEELEEGEIAASGDSHFEAQVSDGSAAQELQADGEEEQAVQPLIKRKRSARQPRRWPLERIDLSSGGVKCSGASHSPLLALPSDRPLDRQTYIHSERKIDQPLRKSHGEHGVAAMETMLRRPNQPLPPAKRRQQMEPVPSKNPPESFTLQQPRTALKHGRVHALGAQQNALEPQKESVKMMSRPNTLPSSSVAARMPEITQKKCKAALLKLKGAVEKDGPQASVIFEIPKRLENPGYYKLIANPLDARTIEQRLDRLEYGGVLDFAADVLLMLDNAARFYKSPEVKAYIRRLQALYLQRMHHSFHDIDFSSLKTRPLATISQPAASSIPPRQQQKGTSQAGALRFLAEPPVTQAAARTAAKTSEPKEEKLTTKSAQVDSKRPQKKAAAKGVSVVQKTSERIKMRQEHGKGGAGESDEPRHPLDLVIRRRKRRERLRSTSKIKAISSVAPAANTNIGKSVGTSRTALDAANRLGIKIATKKARTAGVNNGSGDSSRHSGALRAFASSSGSLPISISAPRPPERFPVPGLNRGPGMPSPGIGQWLTPVKKMRSDTGKRRPSHL